MAIWRKKSIAEDKNLLLRTPWRGIPYLWGLKEDSITEDPKENPINVKPKDNVITASVPSMTFAPQINSFWFFGNGIW